MSSQDYKHFGDILAKGLLEGGTDRTRGLRLEAMRKKARERALKNLLRAQDDHLLGLETFLCPQKGVSVKVGLFVYFFSKCIYFICP